MTKFSSLYSKQSRVKLASISTLFVLMIIFLIWDIVSGPAGLTLSQVWMTLSDPAGATETLRVIVWQYRLPVALMAVLAGSALSLSGLGMQTILNNPLASPYTLGISAAAGLGATLGILFRGAFPGQEGLVLPVMAFLFALGASLSVYLIGQAKKGSAATLILAGVALAFLFNSLISMVQYFSTTDQVQAIVFWLFGSLSGASWGKIAIMAAIMAITAPFLAMSAWKLTVLRLGSDRARGLGVEVKNLRLNILISASLLTAITVCFNGTIGFVGLVAPHISRLIVGEDHRFLLPMSALTGAVMLSLASILSKMVMPGAVFPVGIITSLIGIPIFLFMILKRQKIYW